MVMYDNLVREQEPDNTISPKNPFISINSLNIHIYYLYTNTYLYTRMWQ